MRRNQKWIVAVDLQAKNEDYLSNVSLLANLLTPTRIVLVNVLEKLDIPKTVLKDIPDLQGPTISAHEERLNVLAKKCFHKDQNIGVKVVKGNLLPELLKFTHKEQGDVLILNRADMSTVSVNARKIIRKANCSTLLIPSVKKEAISSILVPVDFSQYSDLAISTVSELHTGDLPPVIHLLHVYRDATRYLDQVFETKDEIDAVLSKRSKIDEELKKYAEFEMKTYKEKMGIPSVRSHIKSITRGQLISEPIDELIQQEQPDLLIIGSKGKNANAATLLSEVSETILPQIGSHITLIQKEKGENQGLLSLILGSKALF